MRIDVFTIFPALVDGFCAESLLGKARLNGLLDLRCHDLREHTADVHRTVDDAPLGWWVEGLGERTAVYASPLQWLVYPDEIRRATEANEVFAPPFPTERSMALARDVGMTYVLVATSSNRIAPAELDAFLAAHPDTVVYRGPDALVLDPRAL